jgi:TRAP-type C4-dicarboxylate transport system permease small subunit
MRYPKLIEKVNKTMGDIAGILVFIIAALSAIQAVMNGLFSKPIPWSLEISQYMLIWIVFLGSALAFQDKKHTAVDFIRDAIGNRWGKGVRRVLTLIGYCAVLFYLAVLLWSSVTMIVDAFKLSKLTTATVQIHINYLYFAMLLGTILMLITVIFIVLNLMGGEEKYL